MRIELKKWSDADFASISEIFTRCDRRFLSDALPMPYTQAHAQAWYTSTVLKKDGIDGLYRIIYADGIPAGVVSADRKPGSNFACDAELGYLMLPEYCGRGVMSAALELFLSELCPTLDLLRVSAQVFAPNRASARVLEKNGFILEGVLPSAVLKDDHVYDLLLYGKRLHPAE